METIAYRRVTGRWINLMRSLWVIFALIMLGMMAFGIVPRYHQLLGLASEFEDGLISTLNIHASFYAGYMLSMAFLLLVVYISVAIVIYWRRQDDWIALLVSLMLLAIATATSDFPDAQASLVPRLLIPADMIRSFSQGLPVLALFVFPTGAAQPRWTRWATLFFLLWTLLRPLLYFTPLHPRMWTPALNAAWLFLWLGGGLAAQVYRHRRIAGPAQKQQTKWVIFGGAIGAAVYVATLIAQSLSPEFRETGTLTWLLWKPVEYTSFILAALPLPIALAVSITRYRLWDIDFIINRSLVYGTLTVLLAGLFGGSLFLIPMIFEHFTGRQQSALAIGASGMLFGTLFFPIRRVLQRIVDRYLYGIHINYQKTGKRTKPRLLSSSSSRTHFGDYQRLESIGRGGMAEIYRAQHPTLNRMVAIKVLPPVMALDSDFKRRFEREARTIASLRHPNIVQLFDFDEAEGTYYMVMEYVDGPSLMEYIKQNGPLPTEESRLLLGDIASALDYAHDQGIIHRDIKPSNILLQHSTFQGGPQCRPILTDFGIAKIIGGNTMLTANSVIGSFDYIAPEQIRDASDIDRRADIYSLGVMTYQMLTGKLPFTTSSTAAMLIAHLQQPAPDPRTLRPDLPDHVAWAVMKSLEKEPDSRFDTAGAMVQALTA